MFGEGVCVCVCVKDNQFEHKKWSLLEIKLFIFKFQIRFLILLQLWFRSWGKTQELKDTMDMRTENY